MPRELARGSSRPPLTREEELEHALRELVRRLEPRDVRITITDLSDPMGSVLDLRASQHLQGMLDWAEDDRDW